MFISISFAYTVLSFISVFFLFHHSSLFCVFLFGRVSFHWSSYHTFICTTLSAGGGESGLLGNQVALDPKVASSQPL